MSTRSNRTLAVTVTKAQAKEVNDYLETQGYGPDNISLEVGKDPKNPTHMAVELPVNAEQEQVFRKAIALANTAKVEVVERKPESKPGVALDVMLKKEDMSVRPSVAAAVADGTPVVRG